jgi:hypothetical protein
MKALKDASAMDYLLIAGVAFGTMWGLEMLAANRVFDWRRLVKDFRSAANAGTGA